MSEPRALTLHGHSTRCGLCQLRVYGLWVSEEPPPIGCSDGLDASPRCRSSAGRLPCRVPILRPYPEAGHNGATMAGRAEPDDSLDFFPTPPWATRTLLVDVLGANGFMLFDQSLYDPCCGEGHITGGSYTGDLTVVVNNQDWLGECKARADGFRQQYDWLEGNRLLFLKADRRATLVCMTLEDFITIIGGRK